MEDLDPPREIAGAADAIIESLRQHALHWDGEILWQSQRHHAYQQALTQLLNQQKAYRCDCSRASLQATAGIYPGRCRHRPTPPQEGFAVRLLTNSKPIGFDDAIQGRIEQALEQAVGDFVILRKDKLFAYQLAVVVDDHYQGVTHVVRGSDLLDSTPRQIFLQQQLGLPRPHYCHFPVISNAAGQKLSKQTYAPALDNHLARENLLTALQFLRQPIPPFQEQQTPAHILHWATKHWSPANIPQQLSICQSSLDNIDD